MYHGHEQETADVALQAYFRKIDEAVGEILLAETAPLVFAGVDYLFPLYREVNHYAGLCAQPVTGNFDMATGDELHQPSWDLVRPLFERRVDQIVEEFGERHARGTATDDLQAVLVAARDGLVETLLVSEGAQLFGRFEPQNGKTTTESGAGSDDLIDVAVGMVLRASGDALVLPAARMPGHSPMVALLRAPVSAVAI